MKNQNEEPVKPFGVEYLEELPPYTPGIFGAGSPATSACTGLQTGGGDDPLKESVCDPPPHP